jgi:acetylxylan esterase
MRFFSFSALSVAASFVGLVSAAQGQLQQVTGNIGPNPNNVGMFVYRPSGLAANPALIVAVHYCSGSAQAYFTGTPYANLADQYKTFMVIFPNAPRSGGCFDVNTPQSLSHNGGGDSQGIASMVQYAITTYGVDASRVFITGLSSGGMSFFPKRCLILS